MAGSPHGQQCILVALVTLVIPSPLLIEPDDISIRQGRIDPAGVALSLLKGTSPMLSVLDQRNALSGKEFFMMPSRLLSFSSCFSFWRLTLVKLVHLVQI